jgi:hypothetical protein
MTRNTRALPGRAETVERNLREVRSIYLQLFLDENFLTLLQAEAMTTVPAYLRAVLDEAKKRNGVA